MMAVRADERAPASPAGTTPDPVATGAHDRGRTVAIGVLVVGAAALFVIPPGSRVDLASMNGYGLVSVLPLTSLAGVALLTLSFLLTLALRRRHPVLLAAELVTLVVCLHGVAALVEPLPRFATAWQHAGFVEYVARTGGTLPMLDARFNWPGFFALAAFVAAFLPGGADLDTATAVLRLSPVAVNLLAVVALLAVLHRLRATWRARWFAAWTATSANWVGQDYFSPQAEGYVIYLLFLAILLTWFMTPYPLLRDHAETSTRDHAETSDSEAAETFDSLWRRLVRPIRAGELPALATGPGSRIVLLLLLLALYAVLSASHQLTPFLLLAACAGLVLSRRCTLTGLPLLLSVMVAGWVAFMAMPFWSGHLGAMLGEIGRLGANVSTSVAGRVTGDAKHQLVQATRLLLAATVLGLAGLGALRRRLRGFDDRAALVLAVAPFTAVALQSYGGEIALRVYLFSLPGTCLLVAFALFPAAGPPSRRTMCAAAVCALVVVGGFFPARYGNERYERVRAGEVAAMEYVYRHDAGGARVLWLTPIPERDFTPNMPWGFRDMEKVSYLSARAPRDPGDVAGLVARMRDLGPGTYLLTTRGQEAYLELNHGFPPDWGDRFRAYLATAEGVEVAAANADAVLYRMPDTVKRPAVGAATSPPSHGPSGPIVGRTPLTPAGLVVLPLLVAVLVARELLRLRPEPAGAHRTRPLTLAAVPLLVLLLVVIAERLALLA